MLSSTVSTDVLELVDPYVPEAVKRTVSNVRNEVKRTVDSLKSSVTQINCAQSAVYKPLIHFQLTDHALENMLQNNFRIKSKETKRMLLPF
jgi:hypothetical protein